MNDRAKWVGAIVQGLVLGALLFLALVNLLVLYSDARIFRYENF